MAKWTKTKDEYKKITYTNGIKDIWKCWQTGLWVCVDSSDGSIEEFDTLREAKGQ